MESKPVKLRNVIFPVWMLVLFPFSWIIVLPGNFIIDLAVIVITLKLLKMAEIKKIAKSAILKTWIFGFIADIIGGVIMFLPVVITFDSIDSSFGKWWYDNMTNAVALNPFENIFAFMWVTIAFAVTALLIFLFNYKFCLKKAIQDIVLRKKLAVSLAIFTAPYLFYLPTVWFYHG